MGVNIKIKPGLDKNEITLVQKIEKDIDKAMVKNGFTRSSTTKSGDSITFRYRQFGVCHIATQEE